MLALIPFLFLVLSSLDTQESRVYVSEDHSFQLTVPTDHKILTSDYQSVSSYIPVCDDDTAVCVVFPAEHYKGTNFGGAGLRVRTVHAKTLKACSVVDEQTEPNLQVPPKAATRVINGVRFSHSTAGGAAMSHYNELNIYRGFVKGKCYELSINVTLSSFQVYEPGTIKEFKAGDKAQVVKDLTRILDSFKILR